jgi:hypothetical protein
MVYLTVLNPKDISTNHFIPGQASAFCLTEPARVRYAHTDDAAMDGGRRSTPP